MRCIVTDLPPEMCAHCRKLPPLPTDVFDEPAEAPPPWFLARYDGRCVSCGHWIEGGIDEIRSDGSGGYVCRECG
jgi:hypothetical protein